MDSFVVSVLLVVLSALTRPFFDIQEINNSAIGEEMKCHHCSDALEFRKYHHIHQIC